MTTLLRLLSNILIVCLVLAVFWVANIVPVPQPIKQTIIAIIAIIYMSGFLVGSVPMLVGLPR